MGSVADQHSLPEVCSKALRDVRFTKVELLRRQLSLPDLHLNSYAPQVCGMGYQQGHEVGHEDQPRAIQVVDPSFLPLEEAVESINEHRLHLAMPDPLKPELAHFVQYRVV